MVQQIPLTLCRFRTVDARYHGGARAPPSTRAGTIDKSLNGSHGTVELQVNLCAARKRETKGSDIIKCSGNSTKFGSTTQPSKALRTYGLPLVEKHAIFKSQLLIYMIIMKPFSSILTLGVLTAIVSTSPLQDRQSADIALLRDAEDGSGAVEAITTGICIELFLSSTSA